ncbi:GH-E family nuclease [Acinetobacter halotolerans]
MHNTINNTWLIQQQFSFERTSSNFLNNLNSQTASNYSSTSDLLAMSFVIRGAASKVLKSEVDDVAKAVGKKDAAENVTKRPSSFRKQTVHDSWNNAADGSKVGTKACPTCDKDVDVAPGQGRRDWDVDHQPKWKDRDLRDMNRSKCLMSIIEMLDCDAQVAIALIIKELSCDNN